MDRCGQAFSVLIHNRVVFRANDAGQLHQWFIPRRPKQTAAPDAPDRSGNERLRRRLSFSSLASAVDSVELSPMWLDIPPPNGAVVTLRRSLSSFTDHYHYHYLALFLSSSVLDIISSLFCRYSHA